MLRLSAFRTGGGTARTLCRPTRVATSDGPYRHKQFKLQRIRRDFNSVLVVGDPQTLTKAAQEVLSESTNKKSDGFWWIYGKRIKECMHMLLPSDIAIIAAALQRYKTNFGLYPMFAEQLIRKKNEINGKSLSSILQIFCTQLKAPLYTSFYSTLSQAIPSIMYQLSVSDIVDLLTFLETAKYKDELLCHRTALKVMAYMHQLDATAIADISVAFSKHGYRELLFYSKIADRAIEIQQTFDKETCYKLLCGFQTLEINATKLMSAFCDYLITFAAQFNEEELIVLKKLIEACDSNLEPLHSKLQSLSTKYTHQ